MEVLLRSIPFFSSVVNEKAQQNYLALFLTSLISSHLNLTLFLITIPIGYKSDAPPITSATTENPEFSGGEGDDLKLMEKACCGCIGNIAELMKVVEGCVVKMRCCDDDEG